MCTQWGLTFFENFVSGENRVQDNFKIVLDSLGL